MICVEEVCQGNELCSSFSDCVLSGQCKKSAQEKLNQSARWQLQQLAEEHDTTPLQFAMDISFSSRKRNLSESSTSEAAKSVIAHMNSILSSNNVSWLRSSESKTDHNSGGLDVSSPINLENVNKKQKIAHSVKDNTNYRSNILYVAPNMSWILSNKSLTSPTPAQDNKLSRASSVMSRVHELHTDLDTKETQDEISKAWLLPLLQTKKFCCEKENNCCRNGDNLQKTQLSSTQFGSIESIMDKIDRLSVSSNKSAIISDIERKESWLLQQCSSNIIDKNILEEVMKEKSEWLSNSSMSSFSIITDIDTTNSNWLLPNQL